MIKFTLNQTKAMQTLLWILKRKPHINLYNVMKVMFSADCYHLNKYGRPIYGEKYVAMNFGTVPQFMYNLTKIQKNVPYHVQDNFEMEALVDPDMDNFSESDIEALEYGISEYADLKFSEVKKKNHKHPAWKKHKKCLKIGITSVDICYEDMIENKDVLSDLTELGSLTENMVF